LLQQEKQSNRKSIFEIAVKFLLSNLNMESALPFLFEKLDVYQKAVNFAEAIQQVTEGFPKGSYYLVDQLNRAAMSISTNIAEGNGRFHKADRASFFRIARGSAFECVPILEICKRRALLTDDRHAQLLAQLESIARMLSGLIKI